MSRIHIYFLVVGYANASLLTDTTFVLIDNILVKAQDHNMFHHLFLSGNPRLHGYVWLRKINPIPTVKDYHHFRSSNKEIATREKFYKCNDFYLGIGSIHHSKVFIEHFMLGPLLDARRKKKMLAFLHPRSIVYLPTYQTWSVLRFWRSEWHSSLNSVSPCKKFQNDGLP